MNNLKVIKVLFVCLVSVIPQQLFSQQVEHEKVEGIEAQKKLPVLCQAESRLNFMGNYMETSLYLGYVFKSNLSVGFPGQYTIFLDHNNHTYKSEFPVGIGIMYLPYRFEKNKDKSITLNPYANFLFYGNSNDPGSYYKIDAGVNLVSPSIPNLLVGVGASYLTNEKNFGVFVSFGIQIP